MKQYIFALMFVLMFFGSLCAQQAGQDQQSSTPGQSDKSAQKQKDESECMAWAKQQVGLGGESSSSQQQPATGTSDKQGSAAPDKNAGNAPADKSSQTASGLADTAAGMAGSMGGGATSKASQLVKEAYSKCMEKKGHKTK